MVETSTVLERLASLETKTDQILKELSDLTKALTDFESRTREKFEQIERMKVELKIIKEVAIWIFAPLIGTLGFGIAYAAFFTLR